MPASNCPSVVLEYAGFALVGLVVDEAASIPAAEYA
jgi:hypothetical protein